MSATDSAPKKVRDRLLKACQAESLIPFVGAGFSCNINQDVAYRRFIEQHLAKRLGHDADALFDIFQNDYPRINDYAIWQLGLVVQDKEEEEINELHKYDFEEYEEIIVAGKKVFCREVRKLLSKAGLNEVNDTDTERWKQHLILTSCFDQIFTTNWDTTLEIAAEYPSSDWPSRECQSYLPINGKIKRHPQMEQDDYLVVVKYHGHIKVKDELSIIAGETDYHERLRARDHMDYFLGSCLQKKGLLFIGYSLTDVNVRYVLNQVNAVQRYFAPGNWSFLVSMDNPANELRKRFERYMRQVWNIDVWWAVDWNANPDLKPSVLDEMRKRLNAARDSGDTTAAADLVKEIKSSESKANNLRRAAIVALLEDIQAK